MQGEEARGVQGGGTRGVQERLQALSFAHFVLAKGPGVGAANEAKLAERVQG